MRRLQTILDEMIGGGVSPAKLLHDAVEMAMVGVVLLDLEGKIQDANATYRRMSGYAAEVLLGRDFVTVQHPDEHAEGRAWLSRVLHEEEGPIKLEGRLTREDSTALWVRIGASVLRDEQGAPHAVVAFVEDIDEQKTAEDLLLRTEKLAAAGRLAATVAHEINNPLEAVSNLLYLAQHEQRLPAVSRRYLRMATEELRRVGHIVSQTLGFYRESGSPQSVDLRALVDDVLTLYQRKLDARQIRVTRSMENAVVQAVPGELRQVVANLLSNALDAMGPYGVLAIELSSYGDEVRLSISDTGHGIASPLLDHIFEPFFTTKRESGTGLGLWVSKGIVEKHQGRLDVVSSQGEDDHGTEFIMTLPRQALLERSA